MLEEVFVPLELSNEFIRNLYGVMLPDFPGFQRRNSKDIVGLQSKEKDLKIWDFLSKIKEYPAYRHMVILAWGGFGKTTLLRNIAFTYAKKPRKVRYFYNAPSLVPFLLYLRKWRDVILDLDPPDLTELIIQYHIPDLPEGDRLQLSLFPLWKDNLSQWVGELLEAGRALVMLDGFDEIANSKERQTISEWIGKQIRSHPKSVFILTSRPGGYKDYVDEEKPKTVLYIKAFNNEQIKRFIKAWYLCQEKYARGGRDTPEVRHVATRNANDLIVQIDLRPELKDITKNPLLLNLIATFHRFYPGNELPKRRAELYREICKLQLGDRPLARRITMLTSAGRKPSHIAGTSNINGSEKSTYNFL